MSSLAHIVGITDTNVPIQGEGPQNGVERFLGQLREWAEQNDMPIDIMSPGTGTARNLQRIEVPTFTIPGYPWLYAACPLAHQRKEMLNRMKELKQEKTQGVVHISTPGPFGVAARSLAIEQELPIVGIHHTDFGSYAEQHLLQHTLSPHAKLDEILEPVLEALPGLKEEGHILNEVRQMFEAMQRIRIQMRRGSVERIRKSPLKVASWWLALQILPGARDVAQLQQDISIMAESYKNITERITGQQPSSALLASSARTAINRYLRWFYSPFSIVIARSIQQKQALRDEIGIEEERIRLLTPAIDTKLFTPKNRRESGYWQKKYNLHIPSDSPVILYVGRITQEKNIPFLANVWKELSKKTSKIDSPPHFVLVGRAVDEELERILEMSGKKHIHHIQHLNGDELLAAYENSDVFWSASPTETFGQVGAEAGAMGLPIIVSDQGGLQTIVEHEKTGFILPLGTKNALSNWVEAAKELLLNSEKQKAMGTAARKHIEHTFAWEASMNSYQDIHKEAAHIAKMKIQDLPKPTELSTKEPVNTEQTGLLFCSDFHAGKDNKEKIVAVPKILKYASEENLRVVYGGDFGDHDMSREQLEKDMELLRNTQKELEIETSNIIFLRGNHDYGFSDALLKTWLDNCDIKESLIAVDEQRGIAMTHGHIYGLDEVIETLNTQKTVNDMEQKLTEKALKEPLKPATVAHDLASSMLQPLAKRGIYLQQFWESVSARRAAIAQWILPPMEFAEKHSKQGMRRLIANLIGPRNDATTAALFGVATSSWLSVYGHTHDEELKKITVNHPETKKPVPVIVANSGKMYGPKPTCVMAKFPDVHILRWYKDEQCWKIAETMSMTDDEIREHYSHMKV